MLIPYINNGLHLSFLHLPNYNLLFLLKRGSIKCIGYAHFVENNFCITWVPSPCASGWQREGTLASMLLYLSTNIVSKTSLHLFGVDDTYNTIDFYIIGVIHNFSLCIFVSGEM